MNFNDYQKEAVKTAIYPEDFKLIYPALGLAGETGECVEKIKKLCRGDFQLTKEYKELIAKELGDVFWYAANIANDLDIDLSTVAQMNLDKLKSRQERGKLQGTGDTR